VFGFIYVFKNYSLYKLLQYETLSWTSIQPATQFGKGTTSGHEPLMKQCKLFSYMTDVLLLDMNHWWSDANYSATWL